MVLASQICGADGLRLDARPGFDGVLGEVVDVRPGNHIVRCGVAPRDIAYGDQPHLRDTIRDIPQLA
jgi:hypothetical protein